MARIRTIKPEFWSDEKLAECDPVTRLVFLGLISMADDCGRLLDNCKVIDAFVFPATSETCRESVANLSRMCRIRRGLTASGQKVIQIVNWERHQKVDKPNLFAALPQIVSEPDVATIRESVANQSRDVRECASTLPTTNDQRPNNNEQKENGASAPKEKVKSRSKAAVSNYSPEFEQFWKAFPVGRRKNKPDAWTAYQAALPAIESPEPDSYLARRAAEYAVSDEGKCGFVRGPAPWLNQQAWNDPPESWERKEENGHSKQSKPGPGQVHVPGAKKNVNDF